MKKFSLGDVYKPKLLSVLKDGRYGKSAFTQDLIAGIIVGIIAFPLAIAFGIASGVTPQQGLITAIVAGFLISFLGGTRFLIGGPTGAFIVIVAGIIAQYGMEGLMIATMMAGVILLVIGFCKLGVVFKFIPYPIVVGFTSGIAVTIFSTQMKDFFGYTIDVPAGFLSQWACYFSNLSNISIEETLGSVVALTIIIISTKLTKKVPGSLIAIVLCTVAAVLLDLFTPIHLATIGDKFPELSQGMSFPKPQMHRIDLETVRGLVSPAFTIAILAAVESLLAATVTDGVTGKHHDSNSELIGEGIANIVTPLFGGIPATGAIARTMANINNGGRTPIAGIVHSIVLLLIFLFLMPYAVYVPLSCLAAILVVVAYNMSEWRSFVLLTKSDKSSVAVLLLTFLLTVLVDLTVAIEFGVLLAVLLFMQRVMKTSDIKAIDAHNLAASERDEYNPEDTEFLDIPQGVDVYEINGPYFFGLANKFEEFEERLKKDTKVKIIRMRKVPFIDATGAHNLSVLCERMRKRGARVILSGVTDEVRHSLCTFGVDKVVGEEYILPHITLALAKAREELGE
ncbi:MAG: STAS domain-containing protein [Bacteroidales bacterium]|nr:STAS domain-containing protein [Bacteroidales bacterium]